MKFDLHWRPPVLETARLLLRPLTSADAVDIFHICSNPRMTRFTLWDTHRSLADSVNYVVDYAESRYAVREPEPLAIVEKRDPSRSVIGTIGAFWVSRRDHSMEIGYNLAEPYWGRGMVVEAARALIPHVYDAYPVERLQARIVTGNDASRRVVQKLGMREEGCLRSVLRLREVYRDLDSFSLLRSEWILTTESVDKKENGPSHDPSHYDRMRQV
jgi:ribosomal-protein-alanine N-acetyltransferase